MQTPSAEFLNVDLHLRSVTNLAVVCEALGQTVMVLDHDRFGRTHWVVLELSRSPATPPEAIRRFARLATRLRGRAKAAWAASEKEFDIGVQCGFEPNPAEWVVESRAVAEAAQLGARLRLTVYAPPQLVKTTQRSRVPANEALQPTGREKRTRKRTGRSREARG